MVKLLLIPARLRWAHLCDECVDFEFGLQNLRGAGIRNFAVFSIFNPCILILLMFYLVDCRCEGHKICDQL